MEQYNGNARPEGVVAHQKTRQLGELRLHKPSLAWKVKNFVNLQRGAPALGAALLVGKTLGVTSLRAKLHGTVYRPNWDGLAPEMVTKLKVALQARVDLTAAQLIAVQDEIANWPKDVRELSRYFGGDCTQFGLLSTRLVTDLGVGFIVDAFQNLVELENMKYHGYGTGGTAEAANQTALVTELTTQYAVDNTRPTGTTTEGASGNIYRTVATLSPDSGGTIAITEHGVFSATSAGVMLDRSLFSAINLVAAADSLQTTYELTVNSGG